MTREQKQKQRALDLLRQRYHSGTLRHRLLTVDPRLRLYYDNMLAHASSTPGHAYLRWYIITTK